MTDDPIIPSNEQSHSLKWISLLLIVVTAILVGFYSHAKANVATKWEILAPGVNYTTLTLNPGKLHAFKIDLTQNDLTLLSPTHPSDVKTMTQHSKTLLTINGGFFSPTGKPLGLRINDGKTLSPVKHTSWWGIFYVENSIPNIANLNDFKPSDTIQFAIQAGPRLLINKNIPQLKAGADNRTALGYNSAGNVIIVVSENAQLTTKQLAKLLRRSENRGGLGCVYALNMDGGSSSQIYAHMGKFVLDIPNYRAIADGIAVIPKKESAA
jgi:uncharacterized protein YigE (DUF2233 family)